MVVNRKVTGTAMAMPAGVALGTGLSMMVTVLGSMVVAGLVNSEAIPENAIGYGSMVILLAASALGAWLTVKRVKHRRMLVCALTGAAYYLCLLACTALFFGGQYSGMGVTAIVVLAGCLSVGLLGLNKGNGASARRRKVRSR